LPNRIECLASALELDREGTDRFGGAKNPKRSPASAELAARTSLTIAIDFGRRRSTAGFQWRFGAVGYHAPTSGIGFG
jgi:hypothetical protein